MSLTDAEFASLRGTIALRGTVRMALLPVIVVAWGAIAVVLALFEAPAAAWIVPVVVLAGGFEAIHALHAGAERIGRYVQLYYETLPNGPRWETTAMAVGPALPGGGVDPLFTLVFAGAIAANLLLSASVARDWRGIALLAVLHGASVVRIARARAAAARQRSTELARMSECLKPEVTHAADAAVSPGRRAHS